MSRLGRGVKVFLLASMAAAAPLAWLDRGRPAVAAVCLGAFGTAQALPRLSSRLGLLRIEGRLELVFLLPFAACWGFGEGLGLFERWAWWDQLSHALAGAAIFAVLEAWARPRTGARRAAVLAVVAALGIGALWEMGEFVTDSVLGTMTQLGNADTMLDLIFDLAGAVGAPALQATGRALASIVPRREAAALEPPRLHEP